MNKGLLTKYVIEFVEDSKKYPEQYNNDNAERARMVQYYQGYNEKKMAAMTDEDIYEYLSQLWAMRIWGNKSFVIEKIINDNGHNVLKKRFTELIWGNEAIAKRWDNFRKNIKGMGPAMISEILCKTHPDKYLLWNRRAYVGLNFLGVPNLPRYDYQLNGKVYDYLCSVGKEISLELMRAGLVNPSLLVVDYFIWEKLQVEENLSKIGTPKSEATVQVEDIVESEFIHDDIRDKLRDIGQWLGFNSEIERKVSQGSKVDTIWEATIGNMGRVIYIFEVQTKGSIDSLIINLLKSLNNPAVQGIVAVSDKRQLEKIKEHVKDVKDLRDKLKYWDYEQVLLIHEKLEDINTRINDLGLIPQGF